MLITPPTRKISSTSFLSGQSQSEKWIYIFELKTGASSRTTQFLNCPAARSPKIKKKMPSFFCREKSNGRWNREGLLWRRNGVIRCRCRGKRLERKKVFFFWALCHVLHLLFYLLSWSWFFNCFCLLPFLKGAELKVTANQTVKQWWVINNCELPANNSIYSIKKKSDLLKRKILNLFFFGLKG